MLLCDAAERINPEAKDLAGHHGLNVISSVDCVVQNFAVHAPYWHDCSLVCNMRLPGCSCISAAAQKPMAALS
jgi:hypothetical protein